MNWPILIGISGKAGHGKDTSAEILKRYFDHVGYSAHVLHFADALKIEVAEAMAGPTGIDFDELLRQFHDPQEKSKWRGLLQWWGTDFRRNMHGESYWIDQTIETIVDICQQHPEKVCVFIVPDMRAVNERDCIVRRGGKTIRVERAGAEINNSHPIETMLDGRTDWDFVVNNDTDLTDLEARLAEVFHEVTQELRRYHALGTG